MVGLEEGIIRIFDRIGMSEREGGGGGGNWENQETV